jgi:hypothetical protein
MLRAAVSDNHGDGRLPLSVRPRCLDMGRIAVRVSVGWAQNRDGTRLGFPRCGTRPISVRSGRWLSTIGFSYPDWSLARSARVIFPRPDAFEGADYTRRFLWKEDELPPKLELQIPRVRGRKRLGSRRRQDETDRRKHTAGKALRRCGVVGINFFLGWLVARFSADIIQICTGGNQPK